MTNSTNSTQLAKSESIGYIIAPFALITVIVNIFFFAIGIKTLKKKAHNMLVISMCGGDCIHGLSLFLLAFINAIGQAFSDLCLSQMTLYFISMSMTLTVALMICIERYVTIRLNNFGMFVHSDGWKKNLTAISLIFTTGYVVLCILVVPRHTNDIGFCHLENYYDPYHYQVIMSLLSGLFVCLALAIIIIYSMIVALLFKFRSKQKKIAPVALKTVHNEHRNGINVDDRFRTKSTDAKDCTEVDGNIMSQSCGMIIDNLTNEKQSEKTKEEVLNEKTTDNKFALGSTVTIENNSVASVSNVIVSDKCDDTISLANGTTSNNPENRNRKQKTSGFLYSDRISRSIGGQQSADSTYINRRFLTETQIRSPWKEWEIRALATSGYIIGSTLLLHGPVIICLITDAFGTSFPKPIGDISALLVALQCVIDPFIYAYRFVELRQGMKNVMCCRSVDRPGIAADVHNGIEG